MVVAPSIYDLRLSVSNKKCHSFLPFRHKLPLSPPTMAVALLVFRTNTTASVFAMYYIYTYINLCIIWMYVIIYSSEYKSRERIYFAYIITVEKVYVRNIRMHRPSRWKLVQRVHTFIIALYSGLCHKINSFSFCNSLWEGFIDDFFLPFDLTQIKMTFLRGIYKFYWRIKSRAIEGNWKLPTPLII